MTITPIQFLVTLVSGLDKFHKGAVKETYIAVPHEIFKEFTEFLGQIIDTNDPKVNILPFKRQITQQDQYAASYSLLGWTIHIFSNIDERSQERTSLAG